MPPLIRSARKATVVDEGGRSKRPTLHKRSIESIWSWPGSKLSKGEASKKGLNRHLRCIYVVCPEPLLYIGSVYSGKYFWNVWTLVYSPQAQRCWNNKYKQLDRSPLYPVPDGLARERFRSLRDCGIRRTPRHLGKKVFLKRCLGLRQCERR